jgi:hypothetical protein
MGFSAKKTTGIENTFGIEAALDLAHQGEAVRRSSPTIELRLRGLLEDHQRSARGFQITPQLRQCSAAAAGKPAS